MWIEMHSLMVSSEGWSGGGCRKWEKAESFESRREASTKTPVSAVLGLGFRCLPLGSLYRTERQPGPRWSAAEAKARGADGVFEFEPLRFRLFSWFGLLVRASATVGLFVPLPQTVPSRLIRDLGAKYFKITSLFVGVPEAQHLLSF